MTRLLVVIRLAVLAWFAFLTNCGYPPLPSVDDAGPPGGSCSKNTDCKSMSALFCDTTRNGGTCVQCTSVEHQACTGNTPRCDNDMCIACADDIQDCGAGGLCLPSGACATSDNIIHVTSNGSTDPDCGTTAKPCNLLEQALLMTKAMPSKTAIKIDDAATYTPGASNFIVDADVTIDMRGGAILHKIVDGPLLEIKNNRTVALLGGTIQGATGVNGDGILCNDQVKLTIEGTVIETTDRSAIDMLAGCSLTMTQSGINEASHKAGVFVPAILDNGQSITLSRSLIGFTPGGGIAVNSGTFAIVGNAFLANGDTNNSITGGIAISAPSSPLNRLDFNTVVKNTAQDGSKGGGIDCDAGSGFIAHNNIVWNNKEVLLLGTVSSQISGSCKYNYSDIGPRLVLAGFDAGHNINSDPLLVNEQTDPHLQTTSPARGAADPNADLTGLAAKDIDGQPRVKPADIGADQLQ